MAAALDHVEEPERELQVVPFPEGHIWTFMFDELAFDDGRAYQFRFTSPHKIQVSFDGRYVAATVKKTTIIRSYTEMLVRVWELPEMKAIKNLYIKPEIFPFEDPESEWTAESRSGPYMEWAPEQHELYVSTANVNSPTRTAIIYSVEADRVTDISHVTHHNPRDVFDSFGKISISKLTKTCNEDCEASCGIHKMKLTTNCDEGGKFIFYDYDGPAKNTFIYGEHTPDITLLCYANTMVILDDKSECAITCVDNISVACISPCCTKVAAICHGKLQIMDVKTKTWTNFDNPYVHAKTIKWSLDGSFILHNQELYSGNGKLITILDYDTAGFYVDDLLVKSALKC